MAERITAPISIRLYDEDNEFKEYSRLFVPWGVLKAAIRLFKTLDAEKLSNPAEIPDELTDELAALVVEAFGNQFSIADLNKGADIEEMLTVIITIVNRARNLMIANPPRPGQ